MEGIPHGGCHWKDCKECFPPGTSYPKSWEHHELSEHIEGTQSIWNDLTTEEMDH